MELFRDMTKRKNADQMNHLLQDVGRAKDDDFILNNVQETAFKFSQIIRLSVSILLIGPGKSRRNINFVIFYSFVTPEHVK